MGDVTRNFSYSEAICSAQFPELALLITLEPIDVLKFFTLCTYVLQPARNYSDQPFKITSGKCNGELNNALGRNPPRTDHHWEADSYRCAVDFQILTSEDTPTVNPKATLECFLRMAVKAKENVGQLVYYPKRGHIHVSLPSPKHWREVLVKIDMNYVNYDPGDAELVLNLPLSNADQVEGAVYSL